MADTTLPMDWPPAVQEATVWAVGVAIHVGLSTEAEARLVRYRFRVLCDLGVPASRDHWARWLAAKVGLDVGATAPSWAYHPAGETSVASYMLTTHAGFWSLCDYPPDIEAALGPPRNDATRACVRRLPSDPAAALRLALLAVSS